MKLSIASLFILLLFTSLSYATYNATGYDFFNDTSTGINTIHMYTNTFINKDYYMPFSEFDRTSNIETNNSVSWYETIQYGGATVNDVYMNPQSLVEYPISGFSDLQHSVNSDFENYTEASVSGIRNIAGFNFSYEKDNYLINNTQTMFINHTFNITGGYMSVPLYYYENHSNFNFGYSGQLVFEYFDGEGHTYDFNMSQGTQLLFNNTQYDYPDFLVGIKDSSGNIQEHVRFGGTNDSISWVYVDNDSVTFIYLLNDSPSYISTFWVDAVCSLSCSLGCAFDPNNVGIWNDSSIYDGDMSYPVGTSKVVKCGVGIKGCTLGSCSAGTACLGKLIEQNSTTDPGREVISEATGGLYETCGNGLDKCENGTWYARAGSLSLLTSNFTLSGKGNTTGTDIPGYWLSCDLTSWLGAGATSPSITVVITDSMPPSFANQTSIANNSMFTLGDNITHNASVWDLGYLKNVTFTLFNSTGKSVYNFTYNCSVSSGGHTCIPNGIGPYWIFNLSNAITNNPSHFTNNSQYYWQINVTDEAGNWNLSQYNWTYLFGNNCWNITMNTVLSGNITTSISPCIKILNSSIYLNGAGNNINSSIGSGTAILANLVTGINIYNISLTNWANALWLNSTNSSTFYNWTNVDQTSGYLLSNNSVNNLFINNTGLNISQFSSRDCGTLCNATIQFYVMVNVTNASYNTPSQGTNVNISNSLGTTIFSQTTNSNGLTPWELINISIFSSSGNTYYNNHTINVSSNLYFLNSTSVNITSQNIYNISLYSYIFNITTSPINQTVNITQLNIVPFWFIVNSSQYTINISLNYLNSSNTILNLSTMNITNLSPSGYNISGTIYSNLSESSNQTFIISLNTTDIRYQNSTTNISTNLTLPNLYTTPSQQTINVNPLSIYNCSFNITNNFPMDINLSYSNYTYSKLNISTTNISQLNGTYTVNCSLYILSQETSNQTFIINVNSLYINTTENISTNLTLASLVTTPLTQTIISIPNLIFNTSFLVTSNIPMDINLSYFNFTNTFLNLSTMNISQLNGSYNVSASIYSTINESQNQTFIINISSIYTNTTETISTNFVNLCFGIQCPNIYGDCNDTYIGQKCDYLNGTCNLLNGSCSYILYCHIDSSCLPIIPVYTEPQLVYYSVGDNVLVWANITKSSVVNNMWLYSSNGHSYQFTYSPLKQEWFIYYKLIQQQEVVTAQAFNSSGSPVAIGEVVITYNPNPVTPSQWDNLVKNIAYAAAVGLIVLVIVLVLFIGGPIMWGIVTHRRKKRDFSNKIDKK